MKVLLASESKERRAIMDDLSKKYGFIVDYCTSGFAEDLPKQAYQYPEEYVKDNVKCKLDCLSMHDYHNDHDLIICVDTIVVDTDENGNRLILEKPSEGKIFFHSPTIEVLTCMANKWKNGFKANYITKALLHLRSNINYVAYTEQVLDYNKRAGGLDITHPATWQYIVDRLEGELDVVRGFPTAAFISLISSDQGRGQE